MDKNVNDILERIESLLTHHEKSSNKKWLRTKETAKYLNISTTQVHELKRNGILPFSKIGGTLYFKKQDIDQLLEANKRGDIDE